MKVNYQKQENISYKGFYNNKILKKAFEFAANNGTLFAATATLTLSGIRPLSILATPKTDKDNKKIACAKSITSSLCGYLIALACSLPLSKAVKKIDTNPKKYLNNESIKALKDGAEKLEKSKAYTLATQLFKLGLGFVIAAPKAILTAIITPHLLKAHKTDLNLEKAANNDNNIPFKGKKNLPDSISKILNSKKFQKFVIKNKDSNFPMHIVAATDTLSTATFVSQTAKNKNYKENQKQALIYNSLISTTLSILSTYLIDYLTKNKTDKFIKKYKEINKNDPNVLKQTEGLKIIKPILIAGCIYYIIIPTIATYFAERINKNN